MLDDKTPKIFISYSWGNTQRVVELAQRLVNHGVDVVLDKWSLKEGQDKYVFMEQCVTDSSIDKVLIICDKQYTEKANSRAGGVGDETMIMSSEIYGKANQEKFIPIIFERDDEGKEYTPAYIKSRIYIDLSDDEKYEPEYEKLLRNIYEKPLYSKPKLGKMPEWLEDDKTNLFPLQDLVRQIKGAATTKKAVSCVNRFTTEYIETLKTYRIEDLKASKQVFDRFVEMKTIRDVFLDFISALYDVDVSFADTMCEFIENMHNTLTCEKNFNANANSANPNDFEIYKIHLWELFICITAFLLYKRDYKNINGIVKNTYFLTYSPLSTATEATNYCRFRHHSRIIEEQYKPSTEDKNKYTLLGNEICTNRTKLPIYTKQNLASADLFLYQIRNGFDLPSIHMGDTRWFPNLYVYIEENESEWAKLKSRKFCEKIYDLFDVKSIDELKAVISKCEFDREMRYNNSFNSAPAILNYINVDEIGTLN